MQRHDPCAAILPLPARRPGGTLPNVARLWTVVVLANIAGNAIGGVVFVASFAHAQHDD